MQHVDAEAVHRLLDYPRLVAALREAHASGRLPQTHATVLTEREGGDNLFISLLAWDSPQAIAVKLVGVFPGNLRREPPEPSIQGLVALFSGATGTPLLTADGAAITFRKTAADSALGADLLARRDAATLLVCGAGGLAPHVIAAHRAVRPSIERVLVWNRTAQRAENLVATLGGSSAGIVATRDLTAALREADIVSCVTMATDPIVTGADLKPGCHVDLIGAYRSDMRESDDDVIRRAGRVFVDTYAGCEGSGDIGVPLAKGLITRSEIVADLYELCSGRHVGREATNEITMFKNVGGAHLDLMAMMHLRHRLHSPYFEGPIA